MESSDVEGKVVDAEFIAKEIGPVIDQALAEASRIAANIVDDASRDRAVDLGVLVREKVKQAEDWRETYYMPAYRVAKNLASWCDPRIKQGKAVLEILSSGISRFDIQKRREADLARERAEAEARRIQEEAERKQREAEEAERRAKEAAEAEARRKREAEEAEKRRIQAEAEAKARAEEEARRVEREERERKLKEEEEARLRHAQEAEHVGNGHKVDSILEKPTAIAAVPASVTTARDQETLRIEQELAQKAAQERAESERKNAEEAAQRQAEEQAKAEQKRKEAEDAAVAAKAAQAAVAATAAIAKRPDERVRTTVSWKWALDGDPLVAFFKLAKAVVEGRAPVQYLGFDPSAPEKFRPTAINKDVQALKTAFVCDGIKAYPQEDKVFLANSNDKEAY